MKKKVHYIRKIRHTILAAGIIFSLVICGDVANAEEITTPNTIAPLYKIPQTVGAGGFTPMHLENIDGYGLYVVDSFNNYALYEYSLHINDYEDNYAEWFDIHGDERDVWDEVEFLRAYGAGGRFGSYLITGQDGNHLHVRECYDLAMNSYNNPIVRRLDETGLCYYIFYNWNCKEIGSDLYVRNCDKRKLSKITPDYVGVEDILYNSLFTDKDYFGEKGDDPEYAGNTKVEYLGHTKEGWCYVFRISQKQP